MEAATQQIPGWIGDNIRINVDHNLQLTQMFKANAQLHEMRRNNTLCDVTINVGDASFQAHKVVLAASSEFFSTMFTSDFQENHQGQVHLNGKPETFQSLLDFSYSGEMNLYEEPARSAMDILKMAHYLQYNHVVKRCEIFISNEVLSDKVNFKDVLDMLSEVDVYGLDNMKKKCHKFLAKNFAINEEFKELMTTELLDKLLQRDDLNIESEKEVFDVTLAWLQHDWENRKQFASQLLQKIRLGVVPSGHLTVTFLRSPELNAIPELQQMIVQVMQLHDSRMPDDMPLCITHPNQFAARTTVTALFSVDQDTYYAERHRNFAKYYDDRNGTWVNLSKFPKLPRKEGSSSDSLIVVKNQLYVARGMGNVNPSGISWPQFLKLDMHYKKWCTMATMTQKRKNYSLVGLDDHIYAIGNEGVAGRTSGTGRVCEVYTISDNQWRAIAPMSRTSILLPSSAVAYRGCIYVFAERRLADQGDCSLMKYDPVRNIWIHLQSYHITESPLFCGLVVLDEKLYCIMINSELCLHNVFEIIIENAMRDPQGETVSTGVAQSQGLIPDDFKKKAFRINQSVFIICRGYCYKTDITISEDQEEPVNLDKWKSAFDQDQRNAPCPQANVTMLTFDKALWK